ncbi:MAG: DUF3240 family protein [Nitrospirota bacterium]|nr:DUF3240 family protein [Nitrospirota bacterium]
MMKCLTLIVAASVKRDLADRLRTIEAVEGFTILSCEGHRSETQHDAFLSVRDRVVGYVPRVRVDVILENEEVQVVIKALKKSFFTDDENRTRIGIWFVTDIQAFGEI